MPGEAPRCPRCRQDLEPFERPTGPVDAVPADMCLSCGGVWLDGPEVAAVYPELAPVMAVARRSAGISQLDCPLCDTIMGGFVLESVSLDLCPSCSGLWVDGAEELLALEEARAKIARSGADLAGAGGYREAPVAASQPAASMLCPGCGREVMRALMTNTGDGPRCRLCIDIATEPLDPPTGFLGGLARAVKRALDGREPRGE